MMTPGSASERDLSPRQVAEAMGVSQSSLKRWCDAGLISTRRTAGGHRRIPVSAVVGFLRQRGFDAARPDLLGMPAGAHRDGQAVADVMPRLAAALLAGTGDDVLSLLFGSFLAGKTFAELGDDLIAPVFASIGHGWERGEVEVYQEHRSTELAQRALLTLGRLLSSPGTGAPRALAATLAGDPYTLPITLVELVLLERGWRATSLGPDHPASTLIAALEIERPRMLCLDVSAVTSRAAFARDVTPLLARASELGVTVVVGGRALDTTLRRTLPGTRYCATLRELVEVATDVAPELG